MTKKMPPHLIKKETVPASGTTPERQFSHIEGSVSLLTSCDYCDSPLYVEPEEKSKEVIACTLECEESEYTKR